MVKFLLSVNITLYIVFIITKYSLQKQKKTKTLCDLELLRFIDEENQAEWF